MQQNLIRLTGVFYVDQSYSQKHAHMLHKHTGILELLYIAGGEGRYLVGNREYAVHAGDLVICNAETLHGETPFQQHSLQTYCCALSGYQAPSLPAGCLIDADDRPVVALGSYADAANHIIPTIYSLYAASPDNLPICEQLATSILLLVTQARQLQQGKSYIAQKNEELVRTLTDYLDRHYAEPLTLDQISAAMHMSISHLSHLFKRETGVSPMQYVIHRRIGEAQSLLMETRLPIHSIEERLGFGSSCHFTAMFKKYVGISPREYRKHFLDI